MQACYVNICRCITH